MEIYKLSRYFWDFSFDNPEKVKPNHVAIYFFAVEHCNRLGWKTNFGLPTTMVMEAIGVKSYSVYKKAFDDLCDWGLFNLVQVSKNQYSSNVIALKENYKANCKAPTKALDKALLQHDTKHSTEHSTNHLQYNKTINQETNEPSIVTNVTTGQAPIASGLFDENIEYRKIDSTDKRQVMEYFTKNKPLIVKPYCDLWNCFAGDFGLPKVIYPISDTRNRKIKVRIREPNFDFPKILMAARKSEFLKTSNFFSFDWIFTNDTNYLKILEGNYNEKR